LLRHVSRRLRCAAGREARARDQGRDNRSAPGAPRPARSHHGQEHSRSGRVSREAEVKSTSLIAAAVLSLAAGLSAQGGWDPAKLSAPPTDSWPTYNGDYSGRRYSTLGQITAANVKALSLAWIYPTGGTNAIKAA